MVKTSIIIVDDHKMMRMGMKLMLAKFDDMVVVGEASHGDELLQLLETTKPDLVLLDIIMPDGLDGIETARRLCKDYPDIKILMLSSENSRDTINELIDIGIHGFISKKACDGDVELPNAIRSVVSGHGYFGRDITQILYSVFVSKKAAGMPELTIREKEIIALCREGLQSKEIADRLMISVRTVDTHKNNIFRKLGINNTVELVRYAMKTGIIRLE
ncbi:MAG: response regulator transcription factor [Tannerella sp.]|jgi:DNA-binding NarL/FixJ family response regulator|nr:response regulator transcription factor [Tannerella sp.]